MSTTAPAGAQSSTSCLEVLTTFPSTTSSMMTICFLVVVEVLVLDAEEEEEEEEEDLMVEVDLLQTETKYLRTRCTHFCSSFVLNRYVKVYGFSKSLAYLFCEKRFS